jgi:hypothetical protein
MTGGRVAHPFDNGQYSKMRVPHPSPSGEGAPPRCLQLRFQNIFSARDLWLRFWRSVRGMRSKLKRYHGTRDLHFITFSCYRREALLGTEYARRVFERTLEDVRRVHHRIRRDARARPPDRGRTGSRQALHGDTDAEAECRPASQRRR